MTTGMLLLASCTVDHMLLQLTNSVTAAYYLHTQVSLPPLPQVYPERVSLLRAPPSAAEHRRAAKVQTMVPAGVIEARAPMLRGRAPRNWASASGRRSPQAARICSISVALNTDIDIDETDDGSMRVAHDGRHAPRQSMWNVNARAKYRNTRYGIAYVVAENVLHDKHCS